MQDLTRVSKYLHLTMLFWLALGAGLAASISAFPNPKQRASWIALSKRQNAEKDLSSLVVDLGYEKYRGVVDGITEIKTWGGYVCIADQIQHFSD